MKVLLAHKFWRKTGGAENYFQDTGNILRAKGHEVKFFSTDFPAVNSSDVFKRDENLTLGHYTDYIGGNVPGKIKSIPEIIYSKKNKELFGNLLDEFKPDIVHVFAIYTTITPSILDACRERRISVVMSCNDYKHICPNYRLFYDGKICEACKGGKFYNAAVKNCCKHSRAVSIVSAIEAYAHLMSGVVKKNVSAFLFESNFMLNKTREFWGDGFNYEFAGKPFAVNLYNPSATDHNYVLYAGRLSDEKGVDTLLKSMSAIKDVPLVIAGSGPEEDHLEKLSERLGLKNITFKGNVNAAEMKKLMSGCSFVVIPSVWYENFPYVLAEAYSHAKPVIGSNIGGIPEYITDGKTGYTYEATDENMLATKINSLFSDKKKITEMGINARRFAEENFNSEIFYTRLMEIYRKTLSNSLS